MKKGKQIWKIILTVLLVLLSPIAALFFLLFLSFGHAFWGVTVFLSIFPVPLLIPLVWLKKRKGYLIFFGAFLLLIAGLLGAQTGIDAYNEAITVNVTPNINPHEYLPFQEDSNIVKIDSKTLDFDGVAKQELPIIDGATAAFPVYSAFVHAVYPESTTLYDGVFEYNTTGGGYKLLGEKKTDLFIGAYPSREQIADAEKNGTFFEYTQIGSEAFVFFVHKDNPVDNLTLEQIRGIYSGAITDWSEVGGSREKIVPYQRDEGSGSQSMLIRLMGDTPIVEPDIRQVAAGMGMIIDKVADYKSRPSSIGFSFRFYLEGMIRNPDIKLLSVNGIAPTAENIRNSSYPIIAPVYAVTYKDNPNENVARLIDWILSDEGQYIIEETGYVGIR